MTKTLTIIALISALLGLAKSIIDMVSASTQKQTAAKTISTYALIGILICNLMAVSGVVFACFFDRPILGVGLVACAMLISIVAFQLRKPQPTRIEISHLVLMNFLFVFMLLIVSHSS